MTVLSVLSPGAAAAMVSHHNVINDTVLPDVDSDGVITNPITVFTQDYDQNNGIISTTTPIMAQPEFTSKERIYLCHI